MMQYTVVRAGRKCYRTLLSSMTEFLSQLFVWFMFSLLRPLAILGTNPLSDVQMVKISCPSVGWKLTTFKSFNRNINILIKMYLLCCEQMKTQLNFSLHFNYGSENLIYVMLRYSFCDLIRIRYFHQSSGPGLTF